MRGYEFDLFTTYIFYLVPVIDKTNNSWLDSNARWRVSAILCDFVLMLSGMLFSRALLSIGFGIFILLTILHRDLQKQIRFFLRTPFLWAMTLLFLLPFLSAFWSEDFSKWSQVSRIKLPLLVFPFCFAMLQDWPARAWRKTGWIFLSAVVAGATWSLIQYISHMQSIHTGYLSAGVILTPVGNDHVRFSLMVCLAIITAFLLYFPGKEDSENRGRIILLTSSIFLIIFLHILAARTGLLCFYGSVFVMGCWILLKKMHWVKGLSLLLLLILLPLAAYFIFPTFKNRVSYIHYDFSLVRKDIYRQGSNDGNRVRSIEAGIDLLLKHPAGVGFGDIPRQTNAWYDIHYPAMVQADRIIPCSEFILYGAGAGWIGLLVFIFVMVLPFFIKTLNRHPDWWMINLSFFLSYLFDMGLEVQYGVFLHAFMLCWFFFWLNGSTVSKK
jgi:hypothetical protein